MRRLWLAPGRTGQVAFGGAHPRMLRASQRCPLRAATRAVGHARKVAVPRCFAHSEALRARLWPHMGVSAQILHRRGRK